MRRILATALALAFVATSALAQTVPAPYYLKPNGYRGESVGTVLIDPATGNPYAASGGGGGSGGPSATAAANGTVPVTAGTNKPVAIDLFSSTSVLIKDAAGGVVDWTAPVNVLGNSANGATANPNPVVIGGRDGTGALRSLFTDTSGVLQVGQGSVFTVQPGNTANTTPWLVTGSGTAGSPATGVMSIQGLAGMTAVSTVGSGPTTAGTAQTGSQLGAGLYNSTLPTLTTGQQAPLQVGTRGGLVTTLYLPDSTNAVFGSTGGADGDSNSRITYTFTARPALFNGTTWDRQRNITSSFGVSTGVAAVEQAGSPFSYINSATTTQVKSGAGILHKVVVNTCVAGATIDLIDNTAGTTVNIGRITCGSAVDGFVRVYDLAFATGLRVVTSAATDVTVVYR